jgi:crotonobetainyl-CoA:carnitine CoA-transferase CaiB-like acyl-CoA transferase
MAGAMNGIRILDLSNVVSGPLAVQMLADQGADVVKVEQPETGDIARLAGAQSGGLSSMFAVLNRNKRSIVLDMRISETKDIMMDLIETADVLVQNFRPGAMKRIGLDYDTIKVRFPELIYVSISGFGSEGPYAARRVYDPIIQAVTGFVATQKISGSERPELIKNIVCDKATALTTAQAITAALFARERGNGGQHVEVAMMDAGLAFLWPDGMWNDTFTSKNVPKMPPLSDIYRVTKTKDGYVTYLVVSDSEWQGMCKALGFESLGSDPKFRSLLDRLANIDELVSFLETEIGKWNTTEICNELEKQEVPFARINALNEVANDPQIVHRKSLIKVKHPQGGPMQMPEPPARFEKTPSSLRHHAPMLGQHSEEILTELGRTPKDIKALSELGVLG